MKCDKCGQDYEGNYCPNGCNAPYMVPVTEHSPVKQGAPTWAIVLLLILFFPVGLGLMWAKNSWKIWVKVLITVFFALLVVGACVDSTGDSPRKEPYDSQSTSSEEDPIFGLNETAAFLSIKVTATEIKESDGDGIFVPEKGNVFIGVKFTVENISDEDQSISSVLMFDAYADGVKCDYSFSAACDFSDGTLDGTITPGKKLIGWYAVEAPKGWQELELQVKSSWLSNNNAVFVFEK